MFACSKEKALHEGVIYWKTNMNSEHWSQSDIMQPHMQAKQNGILIDSKWFLFLINPLDFFFLDIKIYRSAVCLAFKIFRFSSNSICWHRGIKIPQSTMLWGIYILGNDNVEDDESHSSSPKCQEKIDLLFFFFNFMSTSLKKRDMHYILKCKTFWNSN